MFLDWVKSKIKKIRWLIALDDELKFWQNWLESNTASVDGRLLKDKKLQESLIEYLDKYIASKKIQNEKIILLDIGAGPITVLGAKYKEYDIEITPIDPLADKYNKMLRKNKINPHFQTIKLEAEKLSEVYPENNFDLAYSFNALDHSYNPLKAIVEALKVIKPGGYFLLRTFIKEAENISYKGLHQWNFYLEKDEVYISNRKTKYNLRNEIGNKYEIESIKVKDYLFEPKAKFEKPVLWIDIKKL